MSTAYYNEFDPAAAEVLRYLIADGFIAPGYVDTRSIKEVQPDDLRGFTQCHFFAGYGGWSIAARMAGWPDDRPLWSGSCPCQPHSAAAADKKRGFSDDRDLWPGLLRLIVAKRPVAFVAEQVDDSASWIDRMADDLERAGFAVGATDISALAVDADHERVRTYIVAHANGARFGEQCGAVSVAQKHVPAQCAGGGTPFPRERSAGELGKIRRIERGICPVAHDGPGRRQAIRLAGNGLVLPLAAEVIAALMDVLDDSASDQTDHQFLEI